MGQRYSHLSSDERILIEKLRCERHLSVRKIAEEIGRDKSTVSRELRRGLWFASNENGSYRPYRPKRLKTGPWTSGPFYSALAAQRKADLRRRGSRKPRRMVPDDATYFNLTRTVAKSQTIPLPVNSVRFWNVDYETGFGTLFAGASRTVSTFRPSS